MTVLHGWTFSIAIKGYVGNFIKYLYILLEYPAFKLHIAVKFIQLDFQLFEAIMTRYTLEIIQGQNTSKMDMAVTNATVSLSNLTERFTIIQSHMSATAILPKQFTSKFSRPSCN